uniref:Uncharacterized protein n=1 Tax=Triticum urartu TaxID=4572 RepID=A0A8R7JVF4_TRIUA
MLEPLLHLASEPSMLAVLQLVGELIDDVFDLEGEAPDLADEDSSGLVGVLEPLCLLQVGLNALKLLLGPANLAEEAPEGGGFLAQQRPSVGRRLFRQRPAERHHQLPDNSLCHGC